MFWILICFLLTLFVIGIYYIQVHEQPNKSAQPEKGEIIARGCVGRAVTSVSYLCVVFPTLNFGRKFLDERLPSDLPVELQIIATMFVLTGSGALFFLLNKHILRRWKIWRLMFWWITRSEREEFMRKKRK